MAVTPDPCPHTKPSPTMTDHVHTCNGWHVFPEEGSKLHKCDDPSCRRWFA